MQGNSHSNSSFAFVACGMIVGHLAVILTEIWFPWSGLAILFGFFSLFLLTLNVLYVLWAIAELSTLKQWRSPLAGIIGIPILFLLNVGLAAGACFLTYRLCVLALGGV